MRYMTLPDIAALSRRFDVFETGPACDSQLLKARLFTPLAVCGDDLVWGFRFLKAAGAEGISELPVVQIEPHGRLLVALKLENRTGRYSWKERYSIYTLLGELGESEDAESISLAVSGNAGFFAMMKRYACLPGHLKAAINEGRLDLSIAEKVCTLPEAACDLVFSRTGLSFSMVRELLVNLAEIRRRDGLAAGEITALVRDVLAAGDPVKALFLIRNPELSGLTGRFEAFKDRYTAQTGVSLKAPLYFEGDGYTVSFSFSTKAELRRKRETIERLEEGCDELEDLL
ncbi:MAG: hypothetical protein JW852_00435 [Spirochaetales bacterium]|nr:hypothetical protein [Spirochaetales bacterium]